MKIFDFQFIKTKKTKGFIIKNFRPYPAENLKKVEF